ncbi:SpoIIE family protein phosphatase [Actinacidiphila glaucinigra]|uniref:SpoIIE family protein phosphatase n=1 Tax=Actinacidiphila glaucinigra TaxID=235986 RepID=UPI0033AEA82E
MNLLPAGLPLGFTPRSQWTPDQLDGRQRTLPGGPLLGVLPDVDYPEETFTLEEGAALVIVTDGMVEGPGLTLDAGLERAGTLAGRALHDRLDVEAMADLILDAVVAVNHLDNVAVLVIRRA